MFLELELLYTFSAISSIRPCIAILRLIYRRNYFLRMKNKHTYNFTFDKPLIDPINYNPIISHINLTFYNPKGEINKLFFV
jgi:hypothetical protein